ncbi:MAG: ABC transporter permease [SAR324 cluster bacterium]|nr:ABC transporter permease [SAR324 cluster bacterium]
MATALFQRIIYGMVLILAVIVLNFLLIQAAPGDVVDVLVTEAGGGDPEIAAQIRASYGLDQPVYVQLAKYLGNMLTGDLGYSYYRDESVLELLLSHLPSTLILTLSALLFAIFIGTMLGIYAATRPQGVTNHMVTIFSLLGYATPVFWMGMMLMLVFSLYIPIFPSFGFRSIPAPETMLPRILDILHHLVLPTFTLSILFLAGYSRLSRASMLDVLGADYIRTARSKGLSEFVVIFKHALKNASLPVVTIAGLQLGQIFSGAVIVETLFSLPGIGPLLYDSITNHDYPVMMGVLFGTAVTVVVANILTDLVYRLLDPRIRGIS